MTTTESSSAASCSCLTYNSSSYCYKCIQSLLSDKLKSHKRVLQERNLAKERCALQLHSSTLTAMKCEISQYQDAIARKVEYLSQLREECANKTVCLASLSLKNSHREITLDQHRQHWKRIRYQMNLLKSLILYRNDDTDHGSIENNYSLTTLIQQHVKMVQYHRFHLAIQAFQMYKLEVGQDYSRFTMQDLLSMANEGKGGECPDSCTTTEMKRFYRLVQQKVPSGIGNIFGLCVPHRGPNDFHGIIPRDVLISSLRAIASLTNLLARCLGIDLPHPIVLRAVSPTYMTESSPCQREQAFIQDTTTDIVQSVSSYSCGIYDRNTRGNRMTLFSDLDQLNPPTSQIRLNTPTTEPISTGSKSVLMPPKSNIIMDHGKISSSTASLMSLVGSSSNVISRAAHRALDKMKGVHHVDASFSTMSHEPTSQQQHVKSSLKENSSPEDHYPPSMDKSSIDARIQYASCAIIYESNFLRNGVTPTSVKYELKPPTKGMDDQSYSIGLLLLQNDIVALAIRAGVPISMMWPAEAMLLNLHSLFLYCQNQLELHAE